MYIRCICQAKNPPDDVKQKSPKPKTEKAQEPVEINGIQLALVNWGWGNFQLEYPLQTEESGIRKYKNIYRIARIRS